MSPVLDHRPIGTGGSGSGAVSSVNTRTGAVVLTAADVGAGQLPAGVLLDSGIIIPSGADISGILGTSGSKAAAGNDSRLSDARTPTAHKTSHEPGGTDALTLLDNSSIKAAAGIVLSKLATDPLARANHTGTQLASTVSDFDSQVAASAALKATLTTKGDIYAASAASTPARLAVGSGLSQTLVPDSSQTTGLKWIPRFVARTSDSAARNSGNTGATLTADDTLLWSIGANERWWFQANLIISAANITMDFQAGWTVPAACTMLWGATSTPPGNFPSFSMDFTSTTPSVAWTESSTAQQCTNNGTTFLGLSGVVRNGANAGTVTLKWAQITANASDLKLLADSHIMLTRLA